MQSPKERLTDLNEQFNHPAYYLGMDILTEGYTVKNRRMGLYFVVASSLSICTVNTLIIYVL